MSSTINAKGLPSTGVTASTMSDTPSKVVLSRSPRQLAWARFKRDKKTVVAAVIVAIYILLAIAAPILVALGVLQPYANNQDLIADNSLPLGEFGGMSWAHPFGVEPGLGRDTLSRIWFGLSFSLAVAIIGAALAMTIGVILGIISGLTGGWVDYLIGRLIDLTLAFPQTLMLLALSSTVLGILTTVFFIPEGDLARAAYVILVLAVFGWVGVARVVRGQVLSIREREYIDAAKLLGASPVRRWFREVLPNLWAPILVQGTLILPAYISAEAAYAYLNVSIQQPTPTLGNVLQDAVRYPVADFTYFIIPVIVLVTLVVAFNLLGDGLRDALDPKGSR